MSVRTTPYERATHCGSPRRLAGWTLLLLYLCAIIAFTGQPSPLAQILAASGIAISLGLAVWVHGWRGCALLFAACVVITFCWENVGVATGFPFGHYHFEVGRDLPHVGTIPVIVGPLYFGVGYLAWTIAGVLLDEADVRLERLFNLFALPIMSAFLMVQWDLVMDPANSTLNGAWIWHDGGSYFGVPLSNYVGWYLTGWSFFQAFALMIRRWPALFKRPGFRSRTDVQLIAVLLYLAIALSSLIPYFMTADGSVVVDAGGRSWHARDLRGTVVLVMAFSMGPTAVLALLRLIEPILARRSSDERLGDHAPRRAAPKAPGAVG